MRTPPMSPTLAAAIARAGIKRAAFRPPTQEEIDASRAAARAKRIAENPADAARVAKAEAKRERKAAKRRLDATRQLMGKGGAAAVADAMLAQFPDEEAQA